MRDPYDAIWTDSEIDAIQAPIQPIKMGPSKWKDRKESWKGVRGDYEIIGHGADNIMHFMSAWGIAWAQYYFPKHVDRYGEHGWWIGRTDQIDRILAQADADELVDHGQWQQQEDQHWWAQQNEDDENG